MVTRPVLCWNCPSVSNELLAMISCSSSNRQYPSATSNGNVRVPRHASRSPACLGPLHQLEGPLSRPAMRSTRRRPGPPGSCRSLTAHRVLRHWSRAMMRAAGPCAGWARIRVVRAVRVGERRVRMVPPYGIRLSWLGGPANSGRSPRQTRTWPLGEERHSNRRRGASPPHRRTGPGLADARVAASLRLRGDRDCGRRFAPKSGMRQPPNCVTYPAWTKSRACAWGSRLRPPGSTRPTGYVVPTWAQIDWAHLS